MSKLEKIKQIAEQMPDSPEKEQGLRAYENLKLFEQIVMKAEQKEQAMSYLEKTKADAMKFYTEACEDAERWEQIVNDCEDEMIEIGQVRTRGSMHTRLLIMIVLVNILVLVMIVCSNCATTIRGTGQMISGVGQGTGTIVKGVGDYLQEEMEGK
jgi:hypothetical protein